MKDIVRKHITVSGIKGGQGKSTIVALLHYMTSPQKRVLNDNYIISFDPTTVLPDLINDEENTYIQKPDLKTNQTEQREEVKNWVRDVVEHDKTCIIDMPGSLLDYQDLIYKSSRKIIVPTKIDGQSIKMTVNHITYLVELGYPREDIIVIMNDFNSQEDKEALYWGNEIAKITDIDRENVLFFRHYKILQNFDIRDNVYMEMKKNKIYNKTEFSIYNQVKKLRSKLHNKIDKKLWLD